jgi:hypothetical protein
MPTNAPEQLLRRAKELRDEADKLEMLANLLTMAPISELNSEDVPITFNL